MGKQKPELPQGTLDMLVLKALSLGPMHGYGVGQRIGQLAEVISVPNNEAAKQALASIDNVDVFVVGHTAPEQTRKEMVDWLKENFPTVKIVALVPSANLQLPRADYNIVLNDLDEWLALLATAAS
jgi:short-subunit dehydrogenase involved in D-alanine esterification of teichoic acids